jgi:hypothetical protein
MMDHKPHPMEVKKAANSENELTAFFKLLDHSFMLR